MSASDNLTVTSQASINLEDKPFTIEVWFRTPYTLYLEHGLIKKDGAAADRGWSLHFDATGQLELTFSFDGTTVTTKTTTFIPVANTDYHIALERDINDNLVLFVDGVIKVSCNLGTSSTLFNSSTDLVLGADTADGNPGWIDDWRITKGLARYMGETFNVPTAAHETSVGSATCPIAQPDPPAGGGAVDFNNVVLLLSFDGPNGSKTFTDLSNSAHSTTAAAQFQVDATTGKFNQSGLSDGTNDYLIISGTRTDFDFGTGDLTIECFPKISVAKIQGLIGRASFSAPQETGSWLLRVNLDGTVEFLANAVTPGIPQQIVKSTSSVNSLVFPHVAVTRTSGTTRLFINGVVEDSSATAFDIETLDFNTLVAATPGNTINESLFGNIDDLRVVKGESAYTANFTPPIIIFPRS